MAISSLAVQSYGILAMILMSTQIPFFEIFTSESSSLLSRSTFSYICWSLGFRIETPIPILKQPASASMSISSPSRFTRLKESVHRIFSFLEIIFDKIFLAEPRLWLKSWL